MKKIIVVVLIIASAVTVQMSETFAGVPFNNLEGVGGVAFNPLAYPATAGEEPTDGKGVLGTVSEYVAAPRVGTWYVNLGDTKINWGSIGIATTIAKRLEVSYGYEIIGQENASTHYKNNIGTKLLLLPENLFDMKFLPAVSVGAIYKNTDAVVAGSKHAGADIYAVATKLVTQLPRPILLSGGGILTSSYATGALGYDEELKPALFGNADIIVTAKIVTGFEYRQNPKFDTWHDANYWDAHVAFLATKNLSIVGAYVYAGDHKEAKHVGLGDGFVLSLQYSF